MPPGAARRGDPVAELEAEKAELTRLMAVLQTEHDEALKKAKYHKSRIVTLEVEASEMRRQTGTVKKIKSKATFFTHSHSNQLMYQLLRFNPDDMANLMASALRKAGQHLKKDERLDPKRDLVLELRKTKAFKKILTKDFYEYLTANHGVEASTVDATEREARAEKAAKLSITMQHAMLALCGTHRRRTYAHDLYYGLYQLYMLFARPWNAATEGSEHAHQRTKQMGGGGWGGAKHDARARGG